MYIGGLISLSLGVVYIKARGLRAGNDTRESICPRDGQHGTEVWFPVISLDHDKFRWLRL